MKESEQFWGERKSRKLIAKVPEAHELQYTPAPTQSAEVRTEIEAASQPASSSKALHSNVPQRPAPPENIDELPSTRGVCREASIARGAELAGELPASNEGKVCERILSPHANRSADFERVGQVQDAPLERLFLNDIPDSLFFNDITWEC